MEHTTATSRTDGHKTGRHGARTLLVLMAGLLGMGTQTGGAWAGCAGGDPVRVSRSAAPAVVRVTDENGFSGTGFVWDRQGTVVASGGLGGSSGRVAVMLAGSEPRWGRVIARDVPHNLALIRVNSALPLPAALSPEQTGKQAAGLRAGHSVVALAADTWGQVRHRVGVVTATGRALPANRGAGTRDLMQTDVMDRESGGSPIVDCAGRLVAVGSAIFAPPGSLLPPIGLAVPVARVAALVDSAPTLDSRPRWGIGIHIQATSGQAGAGLLVQQVFPGTTAAAAGSRPGDIILGANGRSMATLADFQAEMARIGVGGLARLEIWRDGRRVPLTVAVMALS